MEGEGGGEGGKRRRKGKGEERRGGWEGVRSGRQVVKMEGLGTVYKSRSDTVDSYHKVSNFAGTNFL